MVVVGVTLESKVGAGFLVQSGGNSKLSCNVVGHLLGFILMIWCLECVLVKNDFGREWYTVSPSCSAGLQAPSVQREKRTVGEETYCFLVGFLGYKLRRERQEAMKKLGVCKVYVDCQ